MSNPPRQQDSMLDSTAAATSASKGSVVGITLKPLAKILAAALAVHAIVVAYIGQYTTPEIIRAGALFFCGLTVALSSPLADSLRLTQRVHRLFAWAVDGLLIANLGYACLNFLKKLDDLESFIATFSTVDQASALIAVLTLFELTRRTFGPILAGFGLLTLLYCLFGSNLPWVFRHSGFSLSQTMEIIWYGFQGVFGFPIGIVVLLIFIFIVFGSLLEGTGAGNVMIRLALWAMGGTRGGPAHSAVVASSVFGMSSGDVTSNVVGTGSVTIPLIKKRGFPGHFAGAVEAAASTGGQIVPPVMGAAAFLMAQLAGVSYQTICIAAIMPALLYYASLFVSINHEARRLGLEPVPLSERQSPLPGDGLKSLMFFVPIAAIIITLSLGRSPAMAGFWAVVSTLVTGFLLNSNLRAHPERILSALVAGGLAGARIMVAVGTIGVIIGVFDLTGIGLKFASKVALLGETSLFLSLILAALACLILGMGMPTLPAYLVIVLILGPALTKLGVELLAVHLFVFYFGVLSAITPPVALGAVAAAPIARADPVRTGITALRLAIVGFGVPFVFVFEPSLLLVLDSFTITAFLWVTLRILLAIWLVSSAFSGFDNAKLPAWSRLMRLACSLGMFIPIASLQIAALAIGFADIARDRFGAPKPIIHSPTR